MNKLYVLCLRLLKSPLTFGLGLFLAGLPALALAKEKWEPIAAEDRAATECKAYPGSSAEVLVDQRVLTTSGSDQVMSHFRRLKIFSPKGANDEGVYYIDYPTDKQVWNVAARLTKPNGTVTEFAKKDFTESVAAKLGSAKVKRLVLPIPDLGAGDVLDMKWSETVDSTVSTLQWWYFQDVIPVRHFEFKLLGSQRDCRLLSFNEPVVAKPKGKQAGNGLEMNDIPPFVDEPFLPPMRDVRGWFVLFYTDAYLRWFTKDDVWKELTMYWEEEFRLLTKPNSAIKEQSAKLVQGCTADEEKLGKLYAFVQDEVTNFVWFDSAELQQAKKKLDDSDSGQSPAQTLARRTGYSHHLNELFASLAKAAGFEARLARSASRYWTLDVRHNSGWLFVPDDIVVVKIGESWRYYSPGDYYVPAGMLDKSNEAATSLITDPKKIIFETNPVATADKSPLMRKGRFVLDAEGNLEGDVEILMAGHEGIARKKTARSMQQEEIDTDYRASVTKRLPAAEVSELRWENLKGNKLPVIVRYKLKIPAYADLVGSKMIITPNIFEHGSPAVFASETRKSAVYFDYAWSEHDDVEIQFPEGFTLEAGSAPANVGDPTGAAGVRYQLGYKAKARKLIYKRDFALGGNGSVAFQAVSYPLLKKLFDGIKRSDEHTMVLKPQPVTTEAPATPPAQPAP